jgi:quinol-cytochrome oxidoreductase complex cytochrome b subunit
VVRQEQSIGSRITNSQIWKSFFRHGYPDTERNAALIVVSNVFLHLHPVRLKRHALRVTYTFCLGGLTFFFFLVTVVTGTLLMFYYVPAIDQAYQNVRDLDTTVSFGILMRDMHRYAAQAMVISVFLHMMRVFYTGSYKPPREFNWVIGVGLLVVTFLLSFTGYLLPWDQLALWAVTVGTNIAASTPLLGQKVQYLLIGGPTIGQGALIRFYTLHVVGLPLIASILMVVHFWRIRKDGNISAPL